MRLPRFPLLLAMLALASAGAAAAGPPVVELRQGLRTLSLGGAFTLLEDPKGDLSAEAARARAQKGDFRPVAAGQTEIGFTSSTYWLHYDFSNVDHPDSRWVLELWSVPTRLAEMYEYAGSAMLRTEHTGAEVPGALQRASYFPLSIDVPTGQRREILLRLRSDHRMRAPIAVFTESSISSRDYDKQWIMGILFGVGLALILYNLFLYVSIRDASYLAYVLYGTAIWTLLLGENGYIDFFASARGWSELQWTRCSQSAFCVTFVFALEFATRFLRLSELMPRAARVLRGLEIVAGLEALLFLTGFGARHRALAGPLIDGLALVAILAMISAAIRAQLDGNRTARFYLLSWSLLFAAVAIWLLESNGWLATSVLTRFAVELGVAAEMIVMSLGLADRVRQLRQELVVSAELREALQARDEFLSIASHELNTPLAAMMLRLQLTTKLVQNGNSPDEAKRSLGIAIAQGRRLRNLIEELLDLTRIRLGRLKIEPEEMDLTELVVSVLDALSPLATEAGSVVSRDLRPVYGHWDRLRLEQVVGNLVSNAIKYGNGKPIEASLRQIDAGVEFTIVDHGIGIPLSDQARIFERFERVGTSEQISGLGLGLYISRQIVAAHGGAILVASREGVGSTFTMRLPGGSGLSDYCSIAPSSISSA